MAIHFETIREKINKLDTLANQVDMTKPNTIFQPKEYNFSKK